jgi:geranylgeranyl diphosphate synthase type II
MFTFPEILQRVEREIAQLRFDQSPNNLYAPIEYILSLGGKRIRPALTLIACNIYNEQIEPAIEPALCLEVFHNFTLLHDDLMDKAGKRRNKPTVHMLWGENTAILSGDAMLIASYRLMAGTPSPHLKEVLDLFTSTALDICGGQQYDMEFETRNDVSEPEYMEMIRLKTAVLLACSLKIGAITGGASAEDAAYLYRYGLSLGMAFQLQDDLLDVYGDAATFGKDIGGDILSNKKTFLLIHALSHATKSQKDEMLRWFEQKTFDPERKIETFKKIYNDIGLKEITAAKIEQFYGEALLHLEQLSAPQERLSVLRATGDALLHRKS